MVLMGYKTICFQTSQRTAKLQPSKRIFKYYYNILCN
uniref:Uncharacterized protein n=1 Tax=Anguilla anguilla TaxID=7936 RepID=A0A0E9PWE1_ANGAN